MMIIWQYNVVNGPHFSNKKGVVGFQKPAV